MTARIIPSFLAIILSTVIIGCGQTARPVEQARSFSFWPQPPDEPRIQFVTSYNAASDVKGTATRSRLDELLYGKEAEEDVALQKPYGVAMFDGKIYVCDTRGAGILVLDVRKKESRLMGAQGAGQIRKAVDVAVAPDGTRYVVDTARGAVLAFDAQERFVRALAAKDSTPVAVAVYGDELFVTDAKELLIKVLDRQTGRQVGTIGGPGTEDGKFVLPLSVAVDTSGHVLVTDVVRCKVEKFARDGTYIGGFGRAGNRPGDFVRPKHVRAASDGSLFVVDTYFSNVQAFDEEGRFMGFGALGNHPGSMDLPVGLAITENPQDIALYADLIHPAFQAERLILVTNQEGRHRVSVYAAGGLKPGHTPGELTSSVSATAGLSTDQPSTPSADAPPGGAGHP